MWRDDRDGHARADGHCFEVTFRRPDLVSTKSVACPDGGLVPVPVPPARLPRIAPNAHEAV